MSPTPERDYTPAAVIAFGMLPIFMLVGSPLINLGYELWVPGGILNAEPWAIIGLISLPPVVLSIWLYRRLCRRLEAEWDAR